jgi:hypothetical protein
MGRQTEIREAPGSFDDGKRVRIRGTTVGIFGGVLSGTAWWHSSDDGLPAEGTVSVTPTGLEPPATSHHFDVPGVGSIVTNDVVSRFELVFPGLYEVDSVLTVDPKQSNGWRGMLSTRRASLSVDAEGRAASEWLITGVLYAPGEGGGGAAWPPPTSPGYERARAQGVPTNAAGS